MRNVKLCILQHESGWYWNGSMKLSCPPILCTSPTLEQAEKATYKCVRSAKDRASNGAQFTILPYATAQH